MRATSRPNDPREAYQFLVARTCAKLKTWQFSDVRMKLGSEKPQPLAIHGLVPDLTGILENTLYIFSVETRETLRRDSTHARMVAFAQYALGSKAVFVLVVPREVEDAAYQAIRALGLPNTIVYSVPEWPSRAGDHTASGGRFPFLGKRPSS